MKCLVKVGFAGLVYSGAAGKEIDLPLNEARSLQSAGIVEMLEDYTPAVAFETAEAARKGSEQAVVKRGKTKR